MAKEIELLGAELSRLARNEADQIRISHLVQVLDDQYNLLGKIKNEPGIRQIIQQFMDRLVAAYGDLSLIREKRILDIACGSRTSKAPTAIYVNTPFGEGKIKIPAPKGYTALFEPWFCRTLLGLEGHPVGVDKGNLDGEGFEHYQADLGREGALDFLPIHSFDALQDSRLFGSPEFTTQFPERSDRLKVAEEIIKQERRLLKTGGIVIHSDAENLTGMKVVFRE